MSYPFVLGTAQFGGHYGITNTSGCPSDSEIEKILNIFFEAGHFFLDTAEGYGNAHEKIGTWIKNNFNYSKNNVQIITKIFIKNDLHLLKENVIRICEILNVNSLYSVLIHNPDSLVKKEDFYQLDETIKYLKQEKIIIKAGVSVYDPQDIYKYWNHAKELNIVQCPVSILDQRFIQSKTQLFCKEHAIEIHGRSLFLQGLLMGVSTSNKLKNKKVLKALNEYYNYLQNNKLTGLQACCIFALQNIAKIPFWVTGFNSAYEIQEFLWNMKEIENKNDFLSNMLFNSDYYIDPRTWSYIKTC